MIKVHCPGCSQKISMPENYAGHRVRCTKCSQPFIIPKPVAETVDPAAKTQMPAAVQSAVSGSATSKTSPKPVPLSNDTEELHLAPDPELDNLPPVDPNLQVLQQASRQRAERVAKTLEESGRLQRKIVSTEPAVKSQWYHPFLFPLRGPAMIIIVIFLVARVVVNFLTMGGGFGLLWIFAMGARLAMIGYFFWYFSLCVETAAKGSVRSPDIIAENEGDISDMIHHYFRLFFTALLCLLPMTGYCIFIMYRSAQQNPDAELSLAPFITDPMLWLMLAFGLFTLPMALLSVIMQGSLSGLSPAIIIPSIIKTIVPYLGLVVFFSIPACMVLFFDALAHTTNIGLTIAARLFSCYLAMVGAAMLGRFYFLHEKRLGWMV